FIIRRPPTSTPFPTRRSSDLTFLNPPYLDDLTDRELEEFYSSEYQITDEGCPTTEAPYGFPVAHIKSSPTISLNTHAFWNNLKRSEEHTSELQSRENLVCRLL